MSTNTKSHKMWRNKMLKEHRCRDCGVKLPEDEKTRRCQFHKEYQKNYHRNWYYRVVDLNKLIKECLR